MMPAHLMVQRWRLAALGVAVTAGVAFCPRFLPPLESMAPGASAATPATPCFPLPLQRAALPGAKRTLNIMEPRYQQMYRDLLEQGARRVVVPRYVQGPEGTYLAEAAVVFHLLDVKDAPPGSRTRYVCQHQVLPKVVKITRVLNPEAFEKKTTYLKVECQEIEDLDPDDDLSVEEEQLRDELLQLAMLGRATGSPPLRRYEYMSDSLGRCVLVDHGAMFPEGTINLANAQRGANGFWELANLWQGYCDRRAVALRQQHDRQLQRLRAEAGARRERGARELREALEEELQEHWSRNADSMQVLLQMDRHSDRLALLLQLLQQEARRLRALKAVAQSTGLEAQA